MTKIEIIAVKVLRYMIFGGICLIFEKVMAAIGIFDVFDKDIFCITIDRASLCLALLAILLTICIFKMKVMSPLHIWLKKTKQYYSIFLVIIEMIFFYKCQENRQYAICLLEFLWIFFLLDFENTKIYKYGYEKVFKDGSNYVEKPVIGRENLTKSQCDTLDQLKDVIDKRQSTDSFNMALIGAWGSGKTSITDTLIYEYEQGDEPYFILKIGILTLKESKNVVIYVKKYFEDLFKKYEIGIARQNVAFLTSLSRVFSEKISMGNWFENINDSGFFDLENEKELFVKQVSKLLKKSNKKNIIFVIDDTDRNEDKEQIIKLLAEFSSIDGIISIILLDKREDISRRTVLAIGNEEPVYSSIDKYIHVRIRIENDNRVEYDKNVSRQIIAGYQEELKKKYCYIECQNVSEEVSLFSEMKQYQTIEIIKSKHCMYSKNNVLTEIFMENLRKASNSFGDYFEKIIDEYVYHSKELKPYIEEMLSIPYDSWNMETQFVHLQWVANPDKGLQQLANNIIGIYSVLCTCIRALDWICKQGARQRMGSLAEIYESWLSAQFYRTDQSVQYITESIVDNSQLHQVCGIVFGNEGYARLNTEIKKEHYVEVKDTILKKTCEVEKMTWVVVDLMDFMEVIRKICNNYRTLKMELREAELLNINYLDYLIERWQPSDEIQKRIDAFHELAPDLKLLSGSHPTILSLVNNILFETYISKYGERKEELARKRIYLYFGVKKNIVVVSKGTQKLKESLFLDCSGEVIANVFQILSEEEWHILEKVNAYIWKQL